jgi:ribosomal-protein-alanine N-acetyltransferase
LEAKIRWLIRRDMPEVLPIERASFEFPWSENDFINALRQRNIIGMVAELDEVVVGYMIYELHPNRIYLWSLAVHPEFRRQGVGSALIEKLVSKLYQKRSRINVEVRETNLDAQLFFRGSGFRAVGVIRDRYPETTEDAYLFVYRSPKTSTVG